MNDAIIKFLEWLKSGSITIELFSLWHFGYIAIILGLTFTLAYVFSKKSEEAQNKLINVFAVLVIATYILDFFIMPLAYG